MTPFVCLVAAALGWVTSTNIALVLWPLFLQRHFGWGSHEYASALLMASVARTLGTASAPWVERKFGQFRTVAIVMAAQGVALVSAFTLARGQWVLHLAAVLGAMARVGDG